MSPPLLAVLGAGAGRRFGADKLAQPCVGKPLGRHALDAALGTGLPLVWIGGGKARELVGEACEVIDNPQAACGIGTSVALAARVARERGHAALLIHLADMPIISTADLLAVGAATLPIVAPAAARQADGRPGVPALIPARLFGALAELDGDRGAGPVLAAQADLVLVDLPPDALIDVDTPAALARAEAILRAR